MTIDELIAYTEQPIGQANGDLKTALLMKIGYETLKAHKQGLRMCKYTPLFEDYEPVQTELDEILNNLGE